MLVKDAESSASHKSDDGPLRPPLVLVFEEAGERGACSKYVRTWRFTATEVE